MNLGIECTCGEPCDHKTRGICYSPNSCPSQRHPDDDSANGRLMAEVAVEYPMADPVPLQEVHEKFKHLGRLMAAEPGPETSFEGRMIHDLWLAVCKALGKE